MLFQGSIISQNVYTSFTYLLTRNTAQLLKTFKPCSFFHTFNVQPELTCIFALPCSPLGQQGGAAVSTATPQQQGPAIKKTNWILILKADFGAPFFFSLLLLLLLLWYHS